MVPVKAFMVPAAKFVAVDRDATVRTAAELMRDNGIGSVFVTREHEIIGMLTDADLVRRLVAEGLDPTQVTAEQIMSAPIVYIDENKTLLDANDLMAKQHVRHLGVARDGKLVGMVSVRDLVVFLTNLPRR